MAPLLEFIFKTRYFLSSRFIPVKIRLSPLIIGEDNPSGASIFHKTFLSGPKSIGGDTFSGAIPNAFVPRNCNH